MKKVIISLFVLMFLLVGTSLFANNVMPTDVYSFYIERDTVAPSVTARDPIPGAITLNRVPTISATITDLGTGVDEASMKMKINGIIVTTEITGDLYNKTMTFTPSVPFAYGEMLNVTLDASDLAD